MSVLLKISTLGTFFLEWHNAPPQKALNRPSEALLVYLIAHPNPLSRAELAHFFWDERSQKQAFANLRNVLWQLRQLVGDYLIVTDETVAFDHTLPYWTDAFLFAQEMPAFLNPPNPTKIQNLLALYRGDFLTGFTISESRGFEEWVTMWRERLHRLAEQGYAAVVQHTLDTASYSQGIELAERWVGINPLNETAHSQLMQLYLRAGHKHLALGQYEKCRHILHTELHIVPTTTTQNLAQKAREQPFPPPTKLPNYPTPFIGRNQLTSQLTNQLIKQTATNQLTTLLGMGGSGKSRLAVETANHIAKQHAGRFLDGIFFLNLVNVGDAEAFANNLATFFDLKLAGSRSAWLQLHEFLSDKEMLLILDNFEQLLGHTIILNFLGELLDAKTTSRILVTSRDALGVNNEVLIPVGGLDFPQEMGFDLSYEARDLFMDRAERVLGKALTGDAALNGIYQIAQAVDGIPIALELAAGMTAHRTPTEIAFAIAQDTDTLATTMRDIPQRQRTIRTLFEHSWRLLPPSTQTTLLQLAVFPNDFDHSAVTAITHATATDLATLLRQALVQENESGTRMALHPLVRQFTHEKLATSGNLAHDTRHQHARYFTDFLMQYHLHFNSPQQKQALDQITQEIENVRQCWHTIYTLPDMALMLPALKVIYLFFLTRGWVVELESLFAQAKQTLAKTVGLPPNLTGETAEIVGKLYHFHGWVMYRLGRLQQAETMLFDSLHHFERIQAEPEIAAVQHHLATLLRNQGKYEQALVHAHEALRWWKKLDKPRSALNSMISVGNTYAIMGDLPQARAYLLDAYEMVQEMNLPISVASILNDLGEVVLALPDYEAAYKYFAEALPIYRHHQEMMGVGMTLSNLAQAAFHLGDAEGAVRYAEESKIICQELKNPRLLSYPICTLALVATAKGEMAEGLRLFQSSLSLANGIGYKPKVALILVDMAGWMVKAGELELAILLYAFATEEQLLKPVVRERVRQELEKVGGEMPAFLLTPILQKAKTTTLSQLTTQLLNYKSSVPSTTNR
jgi:DNA-binding SARP family transcriptional activator/predicted ATPase